MEITVKGRLQSLVADALQAMMDDLVPHEFKDLADQYGYDTSSEMALEVNSLIIKLRD